LRPLRCGARQRTGYLPQLGCGARQRTGLSHPNSLRCPAAHGSGCTTTKLAAVPGSARVGGGRPYHSAAMPGSARVWMSTTKTRCGARQRTGCQRRRRLGCYARQRTGLACTLPLPRRGARQRTGPVWINSLRCPAAHGISPELAAVSGSARVTFHYSAAVPGSARVERFDLKLRCPAAHGSGHLPQSSLRCPAAHGLPSTVSSSSTVSSCGARQRTGRHPNRTQTKTTAAPTETATRAAIHRARLKQKYQRTPHAKPAR
jgi:hypothetical protein